LTVIKIWNYLIGYVIIKIEGTTIESFINAAVRQNVFLWDIVRTGRKTVTAKVNIKNVAALRDIVRHAGCRFYIVSKVGLPFTVKKFLRRKLLMGGAFLFLIALYVASSIVWNVEIVGPESVPEAELRQMLFDLGLKPGIFKFQVDQGEIETTILLKDKRISWVDISFKGVSALVKIVEKDLPPVLKEDMPCDIVAVKTGLVEEIIVLKGDPMVKPGDTVTPGQVLISGIVKSGEETPPYVVNAMGTVKARVWYQDEMKVSLIKDVGKRTGRTAQAYRLVVGKKEMAFPKGQPTFKIYDKQTKVAGLSELGLKMDIYHEVVLEKQRITEQEAELIAKDALRASVLDSLPPDAELKSQIYSSNVDAKENAVTVTVVSETIEDIGVKRGLNHESLINIDVHDEEE
jgi:similar to stage IV sporulation protein